MKHDAHTHNWEEQPEREPCVCGVCAAQLQAQTVTLTQAATAAPTQVQMIPTGAAQVVQQKIIQPVLTAAASPQIQTPPTHSPAQQPAAPTSSNASADAPAQQPTKGQARQGGIRAKTPAKPSGGSS